MKALFIVNPRAGRGAGLKIWQRIGKLIARYPQFDAVVPVNSAETRKAAAEAVKARMERVIVVGGDGTLAAVAGELAWSDTALGVVPAGTGNDFCRNAGLPRHPESALTIALGIRTQRIDVGQAAGGLHFLNVAGIGFDAEVASAAGAYPAGLGGTLPYLLGALSTLSRYKPVHMDVTVDERRFSGPVALVAVANGRCYGGGMQIAPLAHQEDGTFDVCIAGNVSRLELLNLLRRVYAGAHTCHPKVYMLRGKEVRLQAKPDIRAHLDGEPLNWSSLEFKVQPRALSVAMHP